MTNMDEFSAGLDTLGRSGRVIVYSGGSATMASNVKGVVLCTAGDVVYTPRQSPSNTITMTGLSAGYVLPHIPGTITESGTTATLATIED